MLEPPNATTAEGRHHNSLTNLHEPGGSPSHHQVSRENDSVGSDVRRKRSRRLIAIAFALTLLAGWFFLVPSKYERMAREHSNASLMYAFKSTYYEPDESVKYRERAAYRSEMIRRGRAILGDLQSAIDSTSREITIALRVGDQMDAAFLSVMLADLNECRQAVLAAGQ